MHGNGCQQAFSRGTTIRALSLQPLGGWQSIAPNHTTVKCLTYEVGSTFLKYVLLRLALIANSWCAHACSPSPMVGSWAVNATINLRLFRCHCAVFRPKPGLLFTLRGANTYCSSLTLTTSSSETCFLMTPMGPIIWICKSDHLAVQYMPQGLIIGY